MDGIIGGGTCSRIARSILYGRQAVVRYVWPRVLVPSQVLCEVSAVAVMGGTSNSYPAPYSMKSSRPLYHVYCNTCRSSNHQIICRSLQARAISSYRLDRSSWPSGRSAPLQCSRKDSLDTKATFSRTCPVPHHRWRSSYAGCSPLGAVFRLARIKLGHHPVPDILSDGVGPRQLPIL